MKTNRLISREQAQGLDLASRVKLETEITDSIAEGVKPLSLPPNWKFADYVNDSPSRKYMFDYLGPLEGKRILDLGCGCHATPIFFALGGARQVVANEISPKALDYVKRMAVKFQVSDRVQTHLGPAEELPFDAESFDLIHGNAVLHHLEIPHAAPVIARVLKSGGKAVFIDPLGHNFLLEFARDYLPYSWKHAQKGTDHPLKIRDVKAFGQHFDECQYRGFDLLALLALYLCGRGNNTGMKRAMRRLDSVLTGVAPFLQRYCRMVVTRVAKRS